MGVLSQNFFWFKWCKIVCFRQNKHRNGTCVKACDSVHDGWTDNHFELGSDSNFSNIYTMYNTGERSEPEKNYKNMIKTTFNPPLLPIKYPHKTPPLEKSQGGGGPDPRSPPLDPRMFWLQNMQSVALIPASSLAKVPIRFSPLPLSGFRQVLKAPRYWIAQGSSRTIKSRDTKHLWSVSVMASPR